MSLAKIPKIQDRGFTLLEFSIMLFIMLLIFSFALPGFNLFFESDLSLETKKVAKLLKKLRHQAIIKGESYLVVFDTMKSEYTFKIYAPAEKQLYKSHPDYPEPIKLKSPIEFFSVKKQIKSEETRQFEFEDFEFEKIIGQEFNFNIDSSGFMDMFDIKLKDQNNKIALSVVNIMGDIEIGTEEEL
jgi:hypothetical protein